MKFSAMQLSKLKSAAFLTRCPAAIAARLRPSLITGCCLTLAIAAPGVAATLVPESDPRGAIAQALPTPLPPLPANDAVAPSSGEQYLVLVNGNSDLLLQQVRQVEPGAFVNYVDGRSMIQAGRFNSLQNAQVRADELAGFGIGAEVQPTQYAGAPIPVAPPTDYALTYPTPTPSASLGQAGAPNTVAATPSAIEFGQAPPFPPTGAPTSAAAMPPAPSTAFPSNSPLPSPTVTPPPGAPAVVNDTLPSGYYVVIPGTMLELQRISGRVVELGAPSSLVRTRTAPRGPHVAVGPYRDRGLAQEWNAYLRDAGLANSRVHFE